MAGQTITCMVVAADACAEAWHAPLQEPVATWSCITSVAGSPKGKLLLPWQYKQPATLLAVDVPEPLWWLSPVPDTISARFVPCAVAWHARQIGSYAGRGSLCQ